MTRGTDVDAYLAQVRAVIARHGWAVQAVVAPGGASTDVLAYTVGLTGFGHPEVAVRGLPVHLATEMLNRVGRRAQDGKVQRPPDTDRGVILDYPVTYVKVTDSGPLTVARAVYGAGVGALQMLYPDAHGRWPWDAECEVAYLQRPFLGPVPTWTAPVEGLTPGQAPPGAPPRRWTRGPNTRRRLR